MTIRPRTFKKASAIFAAALIMVLASAPLTPMVQAAVIVPPPTKLRTFTGGADIAVLWNAGSSTQPKSYNLYRNNIKIASVAPSANVDGTTTRYYDRNIRNGQTYTYKVQAVSSVNATSAFTASVAVTQPLNPTPVPTVTLDPSIPSDLRSWMGTGKTLIQTWYPKFASRIATPGYVPPNSMVLRTEKATGVAGYASGNTITLDEDFARQVSTSPIGIDYILHEATHVLQDYQDEAPAMLGEGIPDWTKNYMFNDTNPAMPGPHSTYLEGYEKSAYFLQWVMTTYAVPDLVRDLNVNAHNGTYTDSLFTKHTGKTVGQLWTEMTGRATSSIGSIKNLGADMCIDTPYYDNTLGNRFQITECRGNTAQQFVTVLKGDGSGRVTLHEYDRCLDIDHSGTADGAYIQVWECNGGVAQDWVPMADGSLVNPNSGKCLQPRNGSLTPDPLIYLEISTCNGSALQKWAIPQV